MLPNILCRTKLLAIQNGRKYFIFALTFVRKNSNFQYIVYFDVPAQHRFN